MNTTKLADAETLIKGINAHYFYQADDINNTCYVCGRLINDMAARRCAYCLENNLAEVLGSAEQAAAVHAKAQAVRAAVIERDRLISTALQQLSTQDATTQAQAKHLMDTLDLYYIDAAKVHTGTQGNGLPCDAACLEQQLAQVLANAEQAAEIHAKCKAVQTVFQDRINLDAAILANLAANEAPSA